MCVHERLAFAFEMGARFGVVFAGWEPMYRNIGLVTGILGWLQDGGLRSSCIVLSRARGMRCVYIRLGLIAPEDNCPNLGYWGHRRLLSIYMATMLRALRERIMGRIGRCVEKG